MKLAAYLVVCICLCLGAIASTTAYVPTLDVAEKAIQDGAKLTLAASAGGTGERHPKQAVVASGTELTESLIEKLRSNGVTRVRVKEFAFGRWTHLWLFLVAVIGLGAGGLIAKREIRREVRAKMNAPEAQANSPERAIESITQTVDGLVTELEGTADATKRTERIVEVLGELQQTHMETVVDSRATLIERFGLSGYAELMDRYAILERQINRAWSAAADGVDEEAMICLRRASELSDAALATIAG